MFPVRTPTVGGGRVRSTGRFCRISTSSWSLVVVPSSIRPSRWIVPVYPSRASTRVVFPLPQWPTSTTLRTLLALAVISDRLLELSSQPDPDGSVTTTPPTGIQLVASRFHGGESRLEGRHLRGEVSGIARRKVHETVGSPRPCSTSSAQVSRACSIL